MFSCSLLRPKIAWIWFSFFLFNAFMVRCLLTQTWRPWQYLPFCDFFVLVHLWQKELPNLGFLNEHMVKNIHKPTYYQFSGAEKSQNVLTWQLPVVKTQTGPPSSAERKPGSNEAQTCPRPEHAGTPNTLERVYNGQKYPFGGRKFIVIVQ